MNTITLLLSRYVAVLLLAVSSAAVMGCPPADRAALLAFRSALHEPYIGIFNTWKGQDCCHGWYGVSCNPETNRVAGITLREVSEDPIFQRARRTGFMTGFISPEICRLTRLSNIIIADWKGISGVIPRCIANLPFLRILDLIGNRISGHIPAGIWGLRRLTILNVANNHISGWIPQLITRLSGLTHLDLRNNKVSGPIPRDFGRLRMLSRALLSGNQISGRIPETLTRIHRLADLDLSMNRISGPIPATLLASSIANMNLSRNSLEGQIPEAFGPRSYFTVLDLSHNNLRGPIPSSIIATSFVGHLDLSHNHLCGKIPAGAPFDHLETSSFAYNDCLCGKPLRACQK